MPNTSLAALSMFSGGGISETYFEDVNIHVQVANELLPERARFYKHMFPHTGMIQGDITQPAIFNDVMGAAKRNNVRFLIATPPCQGMSTLGKKEYEQDGRNNLIAYVLRAIDELKPEYALIENVPKFLKLLFPHRDKFLCIEEILTDKYHSQYHIDMHTLNAMHYGVPQSRPRAIIKLYRKGLCWPQPDKSESLITLKQAIGFLPSLEAGEESGIKWHRALKHSAMQIETMRHTPEGQSAMQNTEYYPKKRDGARVRGFHNTYKRMKWGAPAPARATNNHLISGHNNVHPGRLLADGTWSDARVLTLRELLIVSSLPLDWNIPPNMNETFLRQLIGEAIPPLLCRKIVEKIP